METIVTHIILQLLKANAKNVMRPVQKVAGAKDQKIVKNLLKLTTQISAIIVVLVKNRTSVVTHCVQVAALVQHNLTVMHAKKSQIMANARKIAQLKSLFIIIHVYLNVPNRI